MAIRVLNDRLFILDTEHTSYVFGADDKGMLWHLYYGRRVNRAEDFAWQLAHLPSVPHHGRDTAMLEFSAAGCMQNKETSLHVVHANGTRDFRYAVTNFRVQENTLTVTLSDAAYNLDVDLIFCVHETHDIIERQVQVRNNGQDDVVLQRVFTCELALPGDRWQVMNVSGMWYLEQQVHVDPVTYGKKVWESRMGTTGFNAQPWFAAWQQADEQQGEVYFGALAYTGSFKAVAECVPYHYLNVVMGLNDFEFAKPLAPGQAFMAPKAYLGYTAQGLGDMSRKMHAFAHDCLMPQQRREEVLPVLYNSWYSTEFDVFGDDQKKLADKAAEIGVELFVIDDGWFGQRHHDRAGLGDWYVNPDKFPKGLQDLIDHVHGLGMQFGLWIEPEMVNPDSDLYRAHPDWVYQYENRDIVTGRNQYTLNLTRSDVVDYLIDTFDKLLSSYTIDYIKWDMNRFLAETLSGDGGHGSVWHDHSRGFIRLANELRKRHPNMCFEACAGGGARVNFETLQIFDQFWPSDNTNPLDRCRIQEGYTMMYPPKYMRAWVTDGRLPLALRAGSAMCGALGIGVDLNKYTEEELEQMRNAVATYKAIRHVVQFGKLYRLRSLREHGFQVWQYVKDDEAVVITVVEHAAEALPIIRLKGLQEEALYQVGEGETAYCVSGAFLMQRGIRTASNRDLNGTVLRIRKVEE